MPSIPTRVSAAFAVAALLAAQQQQQQLQHRPDPPSPPQVPSLVLKATTRLVQVSVIVQDGKGQPVADLKKEDFQIKVNGKVQPIRVFSMESNGTLPHTEVKLPPNVFSNKLEQKSGAPSAVTIVLLDAMNTGWADMVYAKAQVIRYLRTLQPGDHIGVYMLGGTLRVLHDYTADSTELLQRIEASKGKDLPDTTKSEATDAMHGDALLLDNWAKMGAVSPAERSFYTTNRVLGTLKALDFIANHLAKVPGRKNLVWVSGGFPLEIGFDNLAAFTNPQIEQRTFTAEVDETIRAVNDANMAIYPVDARGLMVDPQFNAERRTINVRAAPRMVGVKNQQTMEELASRTGGRAFYNTNDLTKAIVHAVDDSRVTYTLGFYPVDESFDGKFHKIEVHVPEHSGLHLRYRKGFFDLPEQPQDAKLRRAELRDAAWSPLDASGVGITAQVLPSKTKPGSLDIAISIDSSSISLEKQNDRWAGRLDVLYIERDDRGNQYNSTDDVIEMRLGEANYQKVVTEGLVYNKTIDRDPKAKMLRIVVRDAASGAIGSVTVPLGKVT